MSWQPEIDEIARRKAAAEQLGGKEAIARQHAAGRQTVRERIDALLDSGSFREIGALAGKAKYDATGALVSVTPANSVIGTGRINGRRVSVSGDDWTIRAGSSEAAIAEKWLYAETYALEMQIPLVRLVETAGGSVKLLDQNAAAKLPCYPTWLGAQMLGTIPIVGIALGPCAGLGAVKAGSAHFSVMVKETAQVFAGGPPVVERAMGLKVDKEELGGWKMHTRQSGLIGNAADSEDHAFDLARRFLSYLPQNIHEAPPVNPCDDPPTRAEEELLAIIPRDKRKIYKARNILELVFDRGSVFEINAGLGRSAITALARLGGRPVGVITSDPAQHGGAMTRASAEKMENFIDLCDTFHLPIIHLVDQPGTIVGPDAERTGAVKGSLRVTLAIEQSQVPFCSVIIRRCFGLAGSAYNRVQGLNLTYAWPSGRWGSIPVAGGVEAAFKAELEALDPAARAERLAELEAALHLLESPFLTAERFRIPDIIDPRDTRRVLSEWLDDAWPLLARQLGPKGRTYRV